MISERVLFSGGRNRNVDVLPKGTRIHLSYYRRRIVLLFVLQIEKGRKRSIRGFYERKSDFAR